ncbi:interleukin-6 receptor subunit beta-like [Acipenser ruthenus]|uniref:interleukin-6 receptor subunit beta-like n=1 Tax=Acipenser ruthenus TaxID=7906 RepID=UPI00274078D7|nr:interleukin-6 receptor subunit beta-like [Acipenser ruthenus]XP_033869939.3 interleukin-6 receptor subunit beta-like [Acipenser ruthenus]XP_033869940.3 interleukin-6 receptor subunit beta-like [Acipenser ruthenus]
MQLVFSLIMFLCAAINKGILQANKDLAVMESKPALPEKVTNITCTYFLNSTITCSWNPGNNIQNQQTEYSLIYYRNKFFSDTPVQNCFPKAIISSSESVTFPCGLSKTECTVRCGVFIFTAKYLISVRAENTMGKEDSEKYNLDTQHAVQLSTPVITKIIASKNSLNLTWKGQDFFPFDVTCILRYKKVTAGQWIQVENIPMEKNEKEASFHIGGLEPFSNYSAAVSCIRKGNTIYWSEWSADVYGQTLEDRPSKAVDLWRSMEDPGFPGTIYLIWKPLSVSDANGIILGYKVNRRNQPWMNTTEAKISFPRSREACEVTVFAYNSAGDSPGVTLRIPAISKQGVLPVIPVVQAFPKNNQLWVEWKAPPSAVTGYVIDWCVGTEAVCDRDWQHVNTTTLTTYLTGNIEPLKRYNISVYPVYEQGAGTPILTEAYLKEGAPGKIHTPEVSDIKTTEATIKWKEIPKDQRNGFIVNYTIVFLNKEQPFKTVNSNVLECTLQSLLPSTQYRVYLKASTKAGSIKSSDVIFTTSLSTEAIVSVTLPFIFMIFLLGVVCVIKKPVLKEQFWPPVPNPSKSSLGHWLDKYHPQNILEWTVLIPDDGSSVCDVHLSDSINSDHSYSSSEKQLLDSYIAELPLPYQPVPAIGEDIDQHSAKSNNFLQFFSNKDYISMVQTTEFLAPKDSWDVTTSPTATETTGLKQVAGQLHVIETRVDLLCNTIATSGGDTPPSQLVSTQPYIKEYEVTATATQGTTNAAFQNSTDLPYTRLPM